MGVALASMRGEGQAAADIKLWHELDLLERRLALACPSAAGGGTGQIARPSFTRAAVLRFVQIRQYLVVCGSGGGERGWSRDGQWDAALQLALAPLHKCPAAQGVGGPDGRRRGRKEMGHRSSVPCLHGKHELPGALAKANDCDGLALSARLIPRFGSTSVYVRAN